MSLTAPPPERVADPRPPIALAPGQALPPLQRRFTRDGPALFRSIPAAAFGPGGKRFWESYQSADKRSWVERGWSPSRRTGDEWRVDQWLTAEQRLTGVAIERLRLLTLPAEPKQAEMVLDVDPLNLPELPNGLESKLLPHQITPSRQLFRALSHGRDDWGYPGAADLSDMGTGKTYQTLAAALATGKRVAVLCPVVGRPGWLRAFTHFKAEPYWVGTYEAVRGGWRPEIVQQHRDGSFTWQNAGEIVLILDEAQALRHEDTLNVKCCAQAIRQAIPTIVASATIAISPLEMRFAGRVTGLHQGERDWHRFLGAHGCMQQGGSWKWNGDMRTLSKIHARLFPARGCRVRKEDLGDACPETQIEVLALDVAEASEIQQQWKETLDMFERLARTGVSAAAIKMKERQARMEVWKRCEKALIDPVAELAREELDEGRSVVVFMNFNETRMAMGKRLNTTAGFFGGQNSKARAWFEQQFQANKIHALVNNIAAGGASVSLHDVTGERPRTAFIFPTDAVVNLVQATGRIDRVGGQSLSRQYIPCVQGALTERMVKRTREKMLALGTLNDGKGTARF